MDIFYYNINMHFLIFPSFPDLSTSSFPFSSFSLWFLNFLFLITSSSNVWFLIRLILWRTHSTDNQIHYFLLHIFHRIMWGSMRENWYFPWPVCTFIGALRSAMRLVSRFFVLFCSRLAVILSLLILLMLQYITAHDSVEL